MSALTTDDIERLFSGAPQYFVRSEGHASGAPHPSVAFPWDECLAIRDLRDHTHIEDKAWSYVTAWPHLARGPKSSSETTPRAHFYPRCRERPNMLSMTGLEKGSMGYQAALEMAVGDALQEDQWGFDKLVSRPQAIVQQRQRMFLNEDALRLRHLHEHNILDLLIKNGKRYSERPLKQTSSDLFNDMFLQLLHLPKKAAQRKDPCGLAVQISALVSVLATPNVWIDFSNVDWRIRVGQLLWASPGDETTEASAAELQEERYWLLLQILMACELVIRLDALTDGEEHGTETIRPAEVLRFEKTAHVSVKWSMNLARAWLENIEIIKTEASAETGAAKSAGWLATLTKRMSMASDHGPHHQKEKRHATYALRGKHAQRQVDGLKHFARELRWPDADSRPSHIAENCRAATAMTGGIMAEGIMTEGTSIPTPLATPTFDSQKFDDASVKRPPSRRRQVSAALHPSGWLSKTYVSGLILPGEVLCHCLMAALLESDPVAMSRLGPMANLRGGFSYSSKSFWSTACIVGRVLAAGKGCTECMGWISSDVTPLNLGDGWVDVEVEDLPDVRQVNKRARIWGKTNVERESVVLGNVKSEKDVFAADFVIPCENLGHREPPLVNMRVELRALQLWPVASGFMQVTPAPESMLGPLSGARQWPELKTYRASLSFKVWQRGSGEAENYVYSLSHDIHFVTAHPCVPSQHVIMLKSPTSPSFQQVDLSGEGGPGKAASVVGHPLHKYYTYVSMHLSEVMAKQSATLDELLGTGAKVLVIDCITGMQPQLQEHEFPLTPVASRSSAQSQPSTPASSPMVNKMHRETRQRQFGSDMEVLVRAICADRGWNALISRRRRGCLACAIREAGALGWKVIIRVD